VPPTRYPTLLALLPLAAVLLATAGAVPAADRPIPADRVLIRDVNHPQGPKLRFAASTVPALAPGTLDDPRVSGGRLEVVGTGDGDGATGVVPLQPRLWSPLGPPDAPTGYEYVDRDRGAGVKHIVVRTGTPGSLVVAGGTAALPYLVNQAQSAIDVR